MFGFCCSKKNESDELLAMSQEDRYRFMCKRHFSEEEQKLPFKGVSSVKINKEVIEASTYSKCLYITRDELYTIYSNHKVDAAKYLNDYVFNNPFLTAYNNPNELHVFRICLLHIIYSNEH